VFVLLSAFLVFDNFSLQTENIIVDTEKAIELGGLKIAHISDYHNRKSELIDSQIFEALQANAPDLIFITGDLIDCNKTDVQIAVDFCTKLCKVAPVYYVTGNHECNFSIVDQSAFDSMLVQLEQIGVNILRQSFVTHQLENGKSVNIYGIDDPYFHCSYSSEITDATYDLCENFTIDKNEINILLAHHPEQLPVYAEVGFDFVFSGHAHGGQGRIFKQGVIAPDQGFFPEYTGGLYTEENTIMILSRGIGNSIVPVRAFNRPNLIFFEI
jgi:predicted MPP superfamily phosphohydrolase